MCRNQHPQPFWRASRNCWYVQIGRKQIKLHPDREEAYRLYHELMSRPPEARQQAAFAPGRLVVEILDAYLEWAKANRSPRTYDWYRDNIQKFVDTIAPTLPVAELKPYHVSRVMDAQAAWSDSTKNGFARSLQRGMNWAERQGLIDKNPIRYLEKPGGEARETPVTPAEYDKLMALVKDEPFRNLLLAAWDSGARPNELMRVEARHCDFDKGRWVFRKKESKGKKKPRVVYLSERLIALCRDLAERHPQGPLFRNRDGEPWRKDAINCRFHRLKKKMGRKIALYDFRHAFCHEGLKRGVDAVTVANLLGHANPSMVATVYSSLSLDPEYLRGSADKARGISAPADSLAEARPAREEPERPALSAQTSPGTR
jgi:integrase